MLDVVTFRGLNGGLNLSIDTNGINDEDLFLLQKCKEYIEDDLFAPSKYTRHLFLDNAENCIKRLLNSNNKKSEYHHLYGIIIEQKCLEKNKGLFVMPSKFRAKQHLIAYNLNPDHPSHILEFNRTDISLPGMTTSDCIEYGVDSIEFEMKLHDETYRNKYSSIIQEIECEFIDAYCTFLDNKSFDNTDTYYYTLESYFVRYILILNDLNISVKQDNFYVFIQNHLDYCVKFAKKFCRYRKYKKALSSMNLFVDYFDKSYKYLTIVSDDNDCRLIIDILLAMGKYYKCAVFIKDCIAMLNNYIDDEDYGSEYESEILYLMSTLSRICCDYGWAVGEPLNDKYFSDCLSTACEQIEELNKDERIEILKEIDDVKIKSVYPQHTLVYYSSICVMYSKIMKSRHIQQEVIEQYAENIKNIIKKK
eukprot:262677_1